MLASRTRFPAKGFTVVYQNTPTILDFRVYDFKSSLRLFEAKARTWFKNLYLFNLGCEQAQWRNCGCENFQPVVSHETAGGSGKLDGTVLKVVSISIKFFSFKLWWLYRFVWLKESKEFQNVNIGFWLIETLAEITWTLWHNFILSIIPFLRTLIINKCHVFWQLIMGR